MDKRYNVFISSTFADLKEERQRVIQTVMELDCIPSGMELFPALDEEQWEFIKRIIDDCDYYILIIGGRYGSITPDGISYTEMEYDYAVAKGIKVIALLHEKPEEIPAGKTDLNPEAQSRLSDFRDKASKNRLVKFWTKAQELPGIVALSLSKTIKSYPAIGWVRANTVPSTEILTEINQLRKENEDLRNQLSNLNPKFRNDTVLASFEDSFPIRGLWQDKYSKKEVVKSIKWGHLFGAISPYLIENPNDMKIKLLITNHLFHEFNKPMINDQDFQTIKIHFSALGLIKIQLLPTTQGSQALFWSLTPIGQKTMLDLRAVRKPATPTP